MISKTLQSSHYNLDDFTGGKINVFLCLINSFENLKHKYILKEHFDGVTRELTKENS